jgi:cytoskeletal protein RodZ
MAKELGIESFHPNFPVGDGRPLMKELSEFLKNERLKRNLTVEALSGLSGISVSMLDSFENCDFERFGASILLRNIVRAYCDVLHLDSEPLLQKYASQIEACNIQDAGIKRYGRLQKTLYKRRRMIALPIFICVFASAAIFYGGEWISKRRSTLYAPPNANRIFSQENLPADLPVMAGSKPRSAKPTGPAPQTANAAGKPDTNHKAAAKSAIATRETNAPVGAPIDPAASRVDGNRPKSSLPAVEPAQTAHTANGDDKASQAQTAVETAAATPSVSNDQAAASQNVPAPDNSGALTQVSPGNAPEGGEGAIQSADAHTLNTFSVQADGQVWIQVKIDGQKTRSELLHAGDHREWVAAKSLDVVVGNAGGVSMKWNDQPLAAPHDSGRVLRFRLPDYANKALKEKPTAN